MINKDGTIEGAWDQVSSKQRSVIKKGQRNGHYSEDISKEVFYKEHEKIFKKQGLECPFSYELWNRLYLMADINGMGKAACYKDDTGNILSLIFGVWDEKSVYQLLGGGLPQYQNLDTYDALIWDGICFAKENEKAYDFEGSMIKRISKSFREFGGFPKQYFRIRKIFNEDIVLNECEQQCEKIRKGKSNFIHREVE